MPFSSTVGETTAAVAAEAEDEVQSSNDAGEKMPCFDPC